MRGYKEIWQQKSEGIIGTITLSESADMIAAGSFNHHIYVLEKSGRELWRRECEDIVGSVAISQDGLFILAGSFDKNLYCYDSQGNMIWQYMTEGYINCIYLSSEMEVILAGSYDTFIYCLDKQGGLKWKFETKGIISCICVNNDSKTILVGSHDRSVYCFDYEGKLLWKFATKDRVLSCDTYTKDGETYFIVGSTDWNIYMLDEKGLDIWSYKTKGSVLSVVAEENGERIYAGSYDAHIYCFQSNGKVLWNHKTGDYVEKVKVSQIGDLVIATSKDKHVYLFNRSGTLLGPGPIPLGIFDVTLSDKGDFIIMGSDQEMIHCYVITADDNGEKEEDIFSEDEIADFEKTKLNDHDWDHVCPHCRRNMQFYYVKRKPRELELERKSPSAKSKEEGGLLEESLQEEDIETGLEEKLTEIVVDSQPLFDAANELGMDTSQVQERMKEGVVYLTQKDFKRANAILKRIPDTLIMDAIVFTQEKMDEALKECEDEVLEEMFSFAGKSYKDQKFLEALQYLGKVIERSESICKGEEVADEEVLEKEKKPKKSAKKKKVVRRTKKPMKKKGKKGD